MSKRNGRDRLCVPGHADVTLSSEVRRGWVWVTVAAESARRLRMERRAVGIIKPDETKRGLCPPRTEGWVQKVFGDFNGTAGSQGRPASCIY